MPRRRSPAASRALAVWRAVWVVVALIGVGAGLWWTTQQPQASPRPPARRSVPSPRPVPPPAVPARPRAPAPVVVPSIPVRPAPAPAGRVAIIFDDAGANEEQILPILALGRPVTIAILPGLPASRAVADQAAAAGLEVLLHLPLEAEEPERRLGPGGVTIAMTDEEIAIQVRRDLTDVPGAVGVNGHMGSKATADRRVMAAVLSVVRERGLFFVDSRTTVRTLALRVAVEMGVPALERTVFLDNEDDPAYIAGQVRQLLEDARGRGWAIAIGHAQKMTAEVLRDLLPEFDRAGVVLVPISVLFHSR